jgi:hypothetical protein
MSNRTRENKLLKHFQKATLPQCSYHSLYKRFVNQLFCWSVFLEFIYKLD